MVVSVERGLRSALVVNASIIAAMPASTGPVVIWRPSRPTQRSTKVLFSPSSLLKVSIEWARKVAGTGAFSPNWERRRE